MTRLFVTRRVFLLFLPTYARTRVFLENETNVSIQQSCGKLKLTVKLSVNTTAAEISVILKTQFLFPPNKVLPSIWPLDKDLGKSTVLLFFWIFKVATQANVLYKLYFEISDNTD